MAQNLTNRCHTPIRVADPIRILALTINPYTPDYQCTPQRLMDALPIKYYPLMSKYARISSVTNT